MIFLKRYLEVLLCLCFFLSYSSALSSDECENSLGLSDQRGGKAGDISINFIDFEEWQSRVQAEGIITRKAYMEYQEWHADMPKFPDL